MRDRRSDGDPELDPSAAPRSRGRERLRSAETRRDSRYDIRIAVSFELPNGHRVSATCRNVGLGGAFIETLTPAPFDAAIALFLPLPGFASVPALPCVVRWTSTDGMGVQFRALGARETHALTELIYTR